MTSNDASSRTLIDELLDEQQRLTAVERFAQKHERGEVAQSRYYRDLIPFERPRIGQQYAFAVDLDACTGCKACVSACHSLNGLDDGELWRNVGALHGGSAAAPYQQAVTMACHHCIEPACLEGCPVMAYDKDAETGIVRHLDDQCIGCQYCVLKCPYDVPKYSAKRGIVRKCDMCTGRLAAGEAPACVQACPTQAIRIEIIEKESFERDLRPDETLVPGAFASTYTKPTTRYRSACAIPANARGGDAHALRLEHAHWPLIFMLLLTQMAVGMFAALAISAASPLVIAAFATLLAGLAVGVLHLGRPLGAWRFFLGLRTSWMSREILAFGMLAGAAAASTAAAWSPPLRGFAAPLAVLTAAIGGAAVFCSAMIYIDTRRAFWSARLTLPRFFGATLLLGAASAACVWAWAGPAAVAIRTMLFAWEAFMFRRALSCEDDPIHRAALTLWRLRRPLLLVNAALVIAATALGLAGCATLALAATAASQLIERYFFFTAVVAPRMPGAVAA